VPTAKAATFKDGLERGDNPKYTAITVSVQTVNDVTNSGDKGHCQKKGKRRN
jgi:hypothetical protein